MVSNKLIQMLEKKRSSNDHTLKRDAIRNTKREFIKRTLLLKGDVIRRTLLLKGDVIRRTIGSFYQ